MVLILKLYGTLYYVRTDLIRCLAGTRIGTNTVPHFKATNLIWPGLSPSAQDFVILGSRFSGKPSVMPIVLWQIVNIISANVIKASTS